MQAILRGIAENRHIVRYFVPTYGNSGSQIAVDRLLKERKIVQKIVLNIRRKTTASD